MRLIEKVRGLLKHTDAQARETLQSGILWRDIVRGERPVGPLGLLVPGGLDDLPSPNHGHMRQYLAATNPCPTCRGRGATATPDGRLMQQCPNCGGTGTLDRWRRIFFDYVFPTVTLTALATKTVVLTILKDAPFEVYWLVGSPSTAGSWSVLITDNSKQVLWSNDNTTPIWNENFAGTAQNPFELPIPYYIEAVASQSAQITDRSNANNSVQLLFRGYKLYAPSSPQPQAQA